MMYVLNPGGILLSFVGLGELLFVIVLWRKKGEYGARALAVFALLFVLGDFSYALQTMAQQDHLRIFWMYIWFVLAAWMPLVEIHLAREYFSLRLKVMGVVYFVFIGISLLFTLLIGLDRYHGFFIPEVLFSEGTLFSRMLYTGGPVLKLLHLYRLIGAAVFLFASFSTRIRERNLYRSRALLFSFMIIIPLLGVFFSSIHSDGYRINPFPFAYILSMFFPQFLYLRGQLFGSVPPDTDLVMDSLLDGVLILGRDDVILDYNARLEEFIPSLRREIVGYPMNEVRESLGFLKDVDVSAVREKEKTITVGQEAGEIRSYELRRLFPSGTSAHSLSALSIRDVSEFQQMNAELEATYADIAEADRLKTMVISIISEYEHTPLAMLKNLSQLLCSHSVYQDPALVKKVFEEIDRLIDRHELLIGNLLPLDIMHRSKGAYSAHVIDLASVLSSLMDPVNRYVMQKGVKFVRSDDEDLLILANRDLLSSALHNVIENAVKYSPSGTEVKVIQQVSDEKVSIIVEDEGFGIDDDALAAFVKGKWGITKMGTAGESGPGIALYASKKFLEWMGGEMMVERKEGVGTRVSVIVRRAFPRMKGE